MGVMQKKLRSHRRARRHSGDRLRQAHWPDSRVVGLEHGKDADLIIEARVRDMDDQEGFSVHPPSHRIAKPGAVLASNTSYSTIDEIAKVTSRRRTRAGACTSSARQCDEAVRDLRAAKTAAGRASTDGVAVARKMQMPRWSASATVLWATGCWPARQAGARKLLFEARCRSRVDAVVTKFACRWSVAMGDLPGLDIAGARARPRHQIGNRRRCCANRPLRPEDRQVPQIRGRLALAAAGSGGGKADRQTLPGSAQAPRGLGRRDPRAHDVPDDQRGPHPRGDIAARPSDIDVIALRLCWPIYRGGPMSMPTRSA